MELCRAPRAGGTRSQRDERLAAHGFVRFVWAFRSATRRMSVFVSTSNSHAHHHSIHRLFENSSADRSGIRSSLLPPSLNIALRPKSPPPDWRSTRSPGEVQLSTHQESIRAGEGGDGLLATGIVCLVPTSERGPEPRDPRLHVRGGGGAAAAARGKCPFPQLVHDSEARSIRCWLYRWFHMLARSSYVVSSHVAQQRLSSGIDVAFCL
jgi:hypothetical protein